MVRVAGEPHDFPPKWPLLTRDLDGRNLGIALQAPITDERIAQAARQLDRSESDIRQRYEALVEQFHLTLAWQPAQPDKTASPH